MPVTHGKLLIQIQLARPFRSNGHINGALTVSPHAVYAGSGTEIIRSTNQGRSWTKLAGTHPLTMILVILPV